MDDLPTEHFEQAEHAQHAGASGNKFLGLAAASIAVLAALAATTSSIETIQSSRGVAAENEAILLKSAAADQWAFFQAKSIKRNLYDIAAEQATGPKADDFAKKAAGLKAEADAIQAKASTLDRQSAEKMAESAGYEIHHTRLTISVTCLQIAIALCTLSIVTKGQRWPWYLGLATALGGLGWTALAFF
jgi:hypothetical protein